MLDVVITIRHKISRKIKCIISITDFQLLSSFFHSKHWITVLELYSVIDQMAFPPILGKEKEVIRHECHQFSAFSCPKLEMYLWLCPTPLSSLPFQMMTSLLRKFIIYSLVLLVPFLLHTLGPSFINHSFLFGVFKFFFSSFGPQSINIINKYSPVTISPR